MPLKLAILHLRMGLRLALQFMCESKDIPTSVSELSKAIVRYPAVLSAANMNISRGNGNVSWNRIKNAIALVESGYEQALRLWLIDRAKERESNEASNTLYRGGNIDHNAIGDAELEEQEFLTLFPSFEDVFDKQGHESDISSSKHLLVQSKEAYTLLQIHHFLICRSGDCSSIYWSLRRTASASLLQSSLEMLPSELDDASLLFRLSLLRDALHHFQGNSKRPETYNFYADANINEVKKATLVLSSLKNRLVVLKQEWPDQMVLQHLLDRCDTVLSLALHSPIAKILSALEQLLLQTEDWEMYANKENTLKQYQQSIIGLIVDWRRLELSCWQSLLDTQAKSFLESISDWWFRLYDATVRGVLDAANRSQDEEQDGIDQYLGTLIPLLNDFISSSPLGQFHARMQLLKSFSQYTALIRDTKPKHHRAALAGFIDTHFANHKASLEKEIKDFIKLASWKDINVHALKQSAQRTHHQLYKVIKKFRDVLRQPISHHLCQSLTVESQGDIKSEKLISDSNALDSILEAYNANFDDRSAELKRNTAKSLVSDVVLTVRELSTISISSEGPAEKRQKYIKALLVRKRKAWSDLLRELKRAGLTSNVKSNVLQNHCDERWIREQPVLHSTEAIGASACKIDSYLSRLMGSLPDLRSALPNHHSDLTTRELQRGISFLESGFSLALELRTQLSTALDQYSRLEGISVRLGTLCSSSKISIYKVNLVEHVGRIKDILCLLSNALQEAREGIMIFNELEKAKVDESLIQEVFDICSINEGFCVRMMPIYDGLSTVPSILSQDEENLLADVMAHVEHVKNMIRVWSAKESRLAYICMPLFEWLSSQNIPSFECPTSPEGNSDKDTTTLINLFLISVQHLISKCPEVSEQPVEDDDERYILLGCRTVLDTTYLLNLGAVLQEFQKVLPLISSENVFRVALHRVLPFLSAYLELVKAQLSSHGLWTKSVLKMVSILCSIMQRLAKEGFCQPPEDITGDAGMGATQTMDGTGLGEGSGNENVSKEIEDESQVEGLQDEGVNQGTEKPDNEDDAIEMSEEFAGDLEDVPDDGSDNEDDDSDAESEGPPEERIEKLDASDPGTVDEKLWGDEKGPDGSNESDDKTTQDHSEEKANDSEVVAKEGKDKDKTESKEMGSEEEQNTGGEQEDEELPEDQGEGEEENTDPNISGAPMDEHTQDANTLDLPDNMDLGNDEVDSGEDSGMEDGGEDDMMDDGGVDEEHEDVQMEDSYEQPPMNASEGGMEKPEEQAEETKEPFAEENQTPDGDDKPLEMDEDNQAVARPDVVAGDGAADPSDDADTNGGEDSTGQGGHAQNHGTKGSVAEDMVDDQEDTKQSEVRAEVEPADSASKGSADGTEQGQATSRDDQPSITANPIRNLGDTLKEIRQRFDEILGSTPNDIPRENTGQSESQGQVEYLQPEDIDSEMQALGPASDDQVAKLDQLNLIDDEISADTTAVMDIDERMQTEEHREPPREPAHKQDDTATTHGESVEGAIIQNTLPKSAEELQEQDYDVEMHLREWQAAEFPDEGAEHMWRLYESMTHDLAYALCEQLRLILEPTMATRLKGDYRTGKRLNMKKIISYIASDYTKDKIWLRRTKPSQREYQVLIAIDDSRSMAESHSVHLAYETLCLISKALTRLESGDVGVAKFGETVDVLHGFDQGPFTDQAGVKVMSAFKFKQKATNVLSLVETSLKVLESARERRAMSSASAADLWQLEIIISDGICQDHDKLRAVLRKAEEQRVMIVFIVLDSLHTGATSVPSVPVPGKRKDPNQGSILQMDKAEFKNVDGRMELQLQKYLDSFPFEYYVILRSVEALPEVLAGTLKQFFERISEEEQARNSGPQYASKDQEEERKGLLSGTEGGDGYSEDLDNSKPLSWSRKRIVGTAVFLIGLLITGAVARRALLGPPKHANVLFTAGELRSNGTHEFKRTVLIVSIDGLRADYLDRGLTPHLLDISKQGLRAKSMQPIFPTLTFPNHWALMTGLHAESHGIVANNFWDPASKAEFKYNRIESCWNPAWWLGEPMWETAEKTGIITANLMWPGPPKTMSGASSTYFVPWKDKVPLQEKLDQIINWIDLPLEERPQLIMAYEPSLDQAGHATGPNSARVNKTLVYVDTFAKDLHISLKARNLTDIVDIIFVSDHGMTDTSHPEHIYMDDILGLDGIKAIEHEDGWPSMGLRFHPGVNVSHYLEILEKAAYGNANKFHVDWVYPHHKEEGDVGMSKGNHGYDNKELSMHAMFVAHGPFSLQAKTQYQRSLSIRANGRDKDGWHSTSEDTYIINQFPNVEIYNLVIKLLGIEEYAAPTNGTTGFWDKYL
ncbi:hypothetical protein BDQ17DRAFT_1419481 [Cyathus striatus]|nr:hypothetical protein BDQ17DRAFT_1419481 [Cyathus striatus]